MRTRREMQPAITSLVEFRLAIAGASTLAFRRRTKNQAFRNPRLIQAALQQKGALVAFVETFLDQLKHLARSHRVRGQNGDSYHDRSGSFAAGKQFSSGSGN